MPEKALSVNHFPTNAVVCVCVYVIVPPPATHCLLCRRNLAGFTPYAEFRDLVGVGKKQTSRAVVCGISCESRAGKVVANVRKRAGKHAAMERERVSDWIYGTQTTKHARSLLQVSFR